MQDPFEARLAASWPPPRWRDVTVVLAVSGGADSTALLRAMAALAGPARKRLVVAHLDHAWRDDSQEDAAWVAQLAQKVGLRSVGERVGDGALDREWLGPGEQVTHSEESARRTRYDFLRRVAGRLGARHIVTAHTADDQAETILHRILRGTGVRGLAGIPRLRQLDPVTSLVRPLLEFRRADVLAYLERLGQPFREDSSNADPVHTRNRIRQLLPKLADDYNADVVGALLRLGEQARETHAVLARQARDLGELAVTPLPGGGFLLDSGCLSAAPLPMVRELLHQLWREAGWPEQAMGAERWHQLAGWAIDAESRPSEVLPGGVLLRRVGSRLEVRRSQGPTEGSA